MLAEVFYRRDDFQKAAASLKGVDVSSNKLIREQYPTLNVAMLESFKGQTPYELHGDGTTTRVKFVKTDPLPIVNVRVNGGKEVTFFIDTGGSEVTLDTDFAKELGVPQFGGVQGTFSGGQHAEVQIGRIESLTARRLDSQKRPYGNASSAPAFGRIWRETNRRNHRDHSVLPFPYDDGLSARRACLAAERRQKPGRI